MELLNNVHTEKFLSFTLKTQLSLNLNTATDVTSSEEYYCFKNYMEQRALTIFQ